MDYKKDNQGYSWAKVDGEWRYWNGTAWVPGTPPKEVEPTQRQALPLNAIAAIVLMVAVVGVAAYFVVNTPKPVLTGVCACLGEGCTQKQLTLEVPQALAEQAKKLGAELEESGGKLVVKGVQGTEYSKGGATVALASPSPGFIAYAQLIADSMSPQGAQDGYLLYSKGTATAALKEDAIILSEGANATALIKCAHLP